MAVDARDRLIVALDAPNDPQNPERLIEPADARKLVELLAGEVRFVKVGWPLYMAGGMEVVREFLRGGLRVFLDLKFGDIKEAVGRVVAAAAREGISFLTLNTTSETVRAAREARRENASTKLLGVTLLTSWSETDLRELGYEGSAEDYVMMRARSILAGGADGVISSPREAARLREGLGGDFLIVTPGIRPSGEGTQDHKRAATPTAAIAGGADYLVVGRPIVTAAEPRAAARRILDEMQAAFDARG